jgi:hypothetical protein
LRSPSHLDLFGAMPAGVYAKPAKSGHDLPLQLQAVQEPRLPDRRRGGDLQPGELIEKPVLVGFQQSDIAERDPGPVDDSLRPQRDIQGAGFW